MKNEKANQSWFTLGIVWAGAMISIPGLLVGNTLITGMSMSKTLLVTLVGYSIIVAIMILQGIQSTDLGKSTVQVASQVFGKKGHGPFSPFFSPLPVSAGLVFRLMCVGRR